MRVSPFSLLLLPWLLLVFALPVARAETLTLADCLREAAERNPAIAAQRFSVQQALGTKLVFRSRALPRLGITALGGQQGSQGVTVLRAQKVRAADGTTMTVPKQQEERNSNFFALGSGLLTQPIFDVGIPAAWRRGGLEVAVAQQNFASVASTQLYNARLSFYRAVFQRDFAAVLHSIAERLDSNVKTTGDLLKAGLANQQVAQQAQVQRANFDPGIFAAQGSYRVALTELLGLMGRDLGGSNKKDLIDRINLSGSLDDEPTPKFDPAQAAAEALAQRPDLKAQREMLRQIAEDARLARADYYPRIQVYLSGDIVPENFVTGNRPSNSVRPGDDVRTTELRYGARYDWNVIDTGAVQGAARRTDYLREAVAVNVKNLEQGVPRDLALLRAQLASNVNQIASARANQATAEETLNIVAGGVAQGTNTQLEFIDAQTGLLNTRATLLQAQFQLALARAEFDRITGRYLRFVSEEKPMADGKAAPAAGGRANQHP